jgi:Domain of unknown function (DUF6443)
MRFRLIILTLMLSIRLAAQTFTINGPSVVLPGLAYQYTITYPGQLQPPLNFVWNVAGGSISAQNNNPVNGPVFANITWNNGGGTVGATETVNNIPNRGFTVITTTINELCDEITPVMQSLDYLQQPNLLDITDCAVPVAFPYSYTYQWQYVANTNPEYVPPRDPEEMQWINLGVTTPTYQPGVLTGYGIRFFRRITTLFDANGNVYKVFKSKIASIKLGYLNPGSICGAIANVTSPCPDAGAPIAVPYGSALGAVQVPGSGGLCTQRDYTWQVSEENMAWTDIGTGVDAPAYTINSNVKLRRKVICNGEVKYTNVLQFTAAYSSANAENFNYVRSNKILKPGVQNWPQADQLDFKDRVQSTEYLDGMGRTVQSVAKEVQMDASGNLLDAVAFAEYDGFGRITRNYLPYVTASNLGFFKPSAPADQQAYIRNKYAESAGSPTWKTYTYENNPLNNIENVKDAGSAWGGDPAYTGVSDVTDYNTAAEGIRIWNIGFNEGDIPYCNNDLYAAGKLGKAVITDEKGHKVINYYDVSGRHIAKKVQALNTTDPNFNANGYGGWLTTYYVYDDMGRQRAIITPKAVKYLIANNWQFVNADVYRQLCFYYNYDARGRVIVKHTPGAGDLLYVYDNNDRMVLSQDENQRSRPQKQWSFYLYDKQNRLVVTGLFDKTLSGTAWQNREAMAAFAASLNNGMQHITIFTGSNETVQVDNPVAGSASFCNNCSNVVINGVNYYDNYNFPGARAFSTNYQFAPAAQNIRYIEPANVYTNVKGFSTGAKMRVLDAGFDDGNTGNDVFLASTIYYDYRGRTLQVLSDNGSGAADITTRQYTYDSKVASSCLNHSFAGSNIAAGYTTITSNDRDVLGRVINIKRNYNNTVTKTLAAYTYDELGRLKTKKLSPDFNGGAGLETQEYDFNIRGQLTGINKNYALSNSTLQQWNHYFGIYLGYDNRDNAFANKQLNGNLTGVLWKTQGDNMPRKYDYEYDVAGRFTKALFVQKENPAETNWSNQKMDFTVNTILNVLIKCG